MPGDSRFTLVETSLVDAYEIHRTKLGDARGFLERMFCFQELAQQLDLQNIAQINRTHTKMAGIVRGMHYQVAPYAEAKLITCLAGAVLDVIVDIRKGSQSFLQSFATVLSSDGDVMLYVPRGFAHGYQTLKPDTELLYFHDNYHDKDCERGLNAQDPALAIDWPNPIALMSDRDKAFPMITHPFEGIDV